MWRGGGRGYVRTTPGLIASKTVSKFRSSGTSTHETRLRKATNFFFLGETKNETLYH